MAEDLAAKNFSKTSPPRFGARKVFWPVSLPGWVLTLRALASRRAAGTGREDSARTHNPTSIHLGCGFCCEVWPLCAELQREADSEKAPTDGR